MPDCFYEGYEARLNDVSRESCPYFPTSGGELYWLAGWDHAHQLRQEGLV